MSEAWEFAARAVLIGVGQLATSVPSHAKSEIVAAKPEVDGPMLMRWTALLPPAVKSRG